MTESANEGEQRFKVAFDLPRESENWPPFSTERLWAAKTQVKLHLRVVNIPFYVRGVSYGDIILVCPDHDRREIVFDQLVEESGHSTVRILLNEDEVKPRMELLLAGFGCSWATGVADRYLAVDIPPVVDYSLLRSELIELKAEGLIGFQESAISTIHRRQLPDFP